jgi:hypothetical protein
MKENSYTVESMIAWEPVCTVNFGFLVSKEKTLTRRVSFFYMRAKRICACGVYLKGEILE